MRIRPVVVGTRAFVLLAMLWSAELRAEPPAAQPPPGRSRAVAAVRVATPPKIDGQLTDEAWVAGAVADGFWVSDTQRPPTDQTSVVVTYDDTALYLAFTCLDARPELVRATQLTRDASPGRDDRVTVELDPRHTHRAVSRFTVTARGTQSDAPAGGRAVNRLWKGHWSAAARRTPFGWTAEMAIPLALLDFAPDAEVFGLNFIRYQNRTAEWSEWADLTPRRLPEEAGHLTGLNLDDAAAAGRLTAMQYLASGRPAAGGGPGREMGTGVDLRYQSSRGVTSIVSTRPDFGAIDADVAGIGYSHTEKFVNDRRPFFQEGGAFFGDREVFHSGRIEAFEVGAKAFGRLDDYAVGVLATTDNSTGRADYVGRVVREVGSTFNVSATLVGTRQEALMNDVLQIRASGRVTSHLRVDGKVARTASAGEAGAAGEAAGGGTRQRAELAYHRAHWYSGGWADRTGAGYYAANGFLPADLPGTAGRGAYGGYNRAFGGPWLRRADASLSVQVRDTTTGLRQRETASLYAGAETTSNITLNAGLTTGAYRSRGDQPDEWSRALAADRSFLTSAFYNSPSGQFGYGAQFMWGETGAQTYDSVAPTVWIAPSPRVSLTYSFERADYDVVRHQHVLSGTWDIGGSQSIGARWVDHDGGYYRLSYRRTLKRSLDAFGVYTADPYDPGRFDVKFIWALSPTQTGDK